MTDAARGLLRDAQSGDREALERFTAENAGLVWSIARRFFGRGAEPDDLYQLGSVGFLKAVYGFDEAFGTEFSTYAVPKIAGEIRRFLRDDGAVKVSRTLKEQAARVAQARSLLEQQLGREPTVSELSRETGLDPETVAMAECAAGPTESLQQESGEHGFALEQMLSDRDAPERMLEHIALRAAIEKLPNTERQIIALRYFHGLTQQRCAAILKISQVQVSRLERKAITRLREFLT